MEINGFSKSFNVKKRTLHCDNGTSRQFIAASFSKVDNFPLFIQDNNNKNIKHYIY